MTRDRDRLEDILEAIERIERYARKGRDAFEADELVQTWIIHHIQVIGEATRRLSEDLQNSYSDIPWSAIVGMRNILVHDYFGIDLEEVWSTVERDIPTLKRKVMKIIDDLKNESDA